MRELEEFRVFLSKRFATDVSDEKIRAAIRLLNRERRLRRRIGGADEGRSAADVGPAVARLQEQHLGHARGHETVREGAQSRSRASAANAAIAATAIASAC